MIIIILITMIILNNNSFCRTLSLNVYRVDDAAMLKFVTDKTAAPYFSNLVWFIGG